MESEDKNVLNDNETENNESEHIEVIDSEESIMEEAGNAGESPDPLQQEVDKLKQEKDEVYGRFLRLQAEFDNFKKRTQKEKEADRKYKSQDLVNDLLPAVDNFERALQVESSEENAGLVEGITMVYRQLKDALKSAGVEEIETTGKEFDPNLHHAVMQIEDAELEANTVVEELQKGYMLKDRVIRPAMVKVNK
ncbi:Hsp70 cofactor [Oceanobacillus picturae]|jgi:molecular chaperone GrpE|uniref:Protein GrpE n=1 Tax=Oceanobacillus picturae TaxID=171693 RepID=A0A0U9HB89_9BACI|nr:nucleotide exchange factor GrpE [Oceanobacillus picturae]RIU93576.1 nucleotide exchange factor GrpE [Oceanobacillus picturae]GAQ19328.1 Hsp70 cofactor [Oceanobacillus picturae]